MSESQEGSSYDEVPYDSVAFVESHPSRQAVIARLFGLKPAPVDKCRVLELGCAAGGNITPMAAYLPNSEFVGIDLSSAQIAFGQKAIEQSGLHNIRLEAKSILDIDEGYGKFDYIISHGVYSWVPEVVRDKILAICSANLKPNGVAYVSYNTYPGWRMRGMIRDMMKYHANRFPTPEQRVAQARGLLDFLANSLAPGRESPNIMMKSYSLMLQGEVESLRAQPDYYLLHEHLETVNDPVYFHEFMESAEKYDLQYLGEADFYLMLLAHLAPEIRDTLTRISGNLIQMEQYMDFVRNRLFRRTLLVHAGLKITRNVQPEMVKDLYIMSEAKPTVSDPDLRTPDTLVEFKTPLGGLISSTNPITKSAFMALYENSPKPLHFEQLRRLARKNLSGTKSDDRALAANDSQELASNILSTYASNAIALHTCNISIPTTIPHRPKVTTYVRYQASIRGHIASALHLRINIDEFGFRLLPRLNGTKDRASLITEMTELAISGELPCKIDDQVVTDVEIIKKNVENSLDGALAFYRNVGLLIE